MKNAELHDYLPDKLYLNSFEYLQRKLELFCYSKNVVYEISYPKHTIKDDKIRYVCHIQVDDNISIGTSFLLYKATSNALMKAIEQA